MFFGTVVDWRTTVERELREASKAALDAGDANVETSQARQIAAHMTSDDWASFAQAWRTSYMTFCRALATDPAKQWKSVDQHHYDSLKELLHSRGLQGLWTEDQILDLSLVWHRLDPWADSADGLRLLGDKVKTATLSNGNTALLADLVDHGGLRFAHVFSCEEFKTYKPNPKTYTGAVARLGFEPRECAMVAAHLFDLQAASACGLRTIYVARPQEEQFNGATVAKIKDSVDIDIWVDEDEEGLLTIFHRLFVGS